MASTMSDRESAEKSSTHEEYDEEAGAASNAEPDTEPDAGSEAEPEAEPGWKSEEDSEDEANGVVPQTIATHLQSAPFSFFVGDMGWRFPMPRKLVGAHSRRLKRSMLRRSKMELPDVDANTFIRFIEYMFTGRYSDPQKYFEPSTRAGNTPKEDNTVDERGIIKPLDNSITSETPDYFSAIEHSQPHVVVPGDRYLTSPAGATQADSDIRTLEAFRSADFVQNKSKIIAPLTAIVCWKKRAHHVLIAHARVYFFAGEYGIEGLKAVALRKLQRALCMWLDEHQALKRLDIDAVQSFVQVQASSASWNASAIVTLLGTAVEVRRLSTRDTSE